MPHLPTMKWDYQDNFKSADLVGGGEAFYVYYSYGKRVRKIIEKGDITEEFILLGRGVKVKKQKKLRFR